MKYTSLGVSKEMDVTSIVLEHNPQNVNDNNMTMWHCPICTNPIFQFGGRMMAILPGLIPNKYPPVIVMCDKCRKKYIIISISTL